MRADVQVQRGIGPFRDKVRRVFRNKNAKSISHRDGAAWRRRLSDGRLVSR